ncbi:MAG: hypothetical protein M5U26_12420 [Planctomycetota bacterium]|nr:hypothetical protein [Planctomycetota bacterium]
MSQAARFITGLLVVALGSGLAGSLRAEEGGEANHPDVIVDGVRYTWEEAKKKYPDIVQAEKSGSATVKTESGGEATLETAPAAKSEPAAETTELAPPAKAEEDEAREVPKNEAAEDEEKDEKKEDKAGVVVIQEPDPEFAERVALLRARQKLLEEGFIRKNIRLLTSPEWRTAQAELVKLGRSAVPHLIDAMAAQDAYPAKSYSLQAPRRATRQRPLAEVAYEVLVNIVQNHSNFKGELPGRNQAEWQEFWNLNGASILLAQEALLQTAQP